VDTVAEEFERKFVEAASKLRVGNPLDYKGKRQILRALT